MNNYRDLIIIPCFIIAIITLFIASFCSANDVGAYTKFYYISVLYNSSSNSIKLDQSKPVEITDINFTRDTGSGSQFYAQVVDFHGTPKNFANGKDKFYLGKWEIFVFWDGFDKNGKPTGGSKKVEEGVTEISIPYFTDGKTVNIFDSKTDQFSLSVDVSKFGTKNINDSQNVQSKTEMTQEEKIAKQKRSKTRNSYIVMSILILFTIIIAVIVYIFYRKYFGTNESKY
jgi:hypothetical protein